MIDLLKNICTMTEDELYDFSCEQLDVEGHGDFVYRPGTIPILMVAHLDTVHRETWTDVLHDTKHNILWSPVGIGGDDRCGVAMILTMAQTYDVGVLLCKQEENGGMGATAASIQLNLSDDYNFMIELDRNGFEDAVFYQCYNKEFRKYILSHDFKLAHGTFSDISILSRPWNLASVNLSCGYYGEHRISEFINFNHVLGIFDKVVNIVEDYTERDINIKYEHHAKKIKYVNKYKTDTEGIQKLLPPQYVCTNCIKKNTCINVHDCGTYQTYLDDVFYFYDCNGRYQ